MSPNSGGLSSSATSGTGITRSIREHLNFKDDKKWKEFSTRRLELIDKLNLSSKKASEQDEDIKGIADLLRIEFGYPIETLPDFDRLVRAAIQSVRRNRKRSSRARVHNDRFVMVVDEKKPNLSTINSPGMSSSLFAPNNGSTSSLHKPLMHPQIRHQQLPLPIEPQYIINSSSQTPTSSMSSSLSTSPSTLLPSIKTMTNSNSLQSSSATSSTSSTFITNNVMNTKDIFELSTSCKTKLLNFIQKSKNCLLLSNNDISIHSDNLMNLGKSIMSSSISFVLERFFNDISTESINYLYEKLNSNLIFSRILKSLGYLSNDVLVLSESQASNLLCKLIGCCVKDFGFDPIAYTIGEIFHEIILNEYPLTATQVTKITQESLFTPLLPIVPQDADNEVMKEVKLKYGTRSLDFKFTPLSSAPPTYLELIENGKIGFGIDKSKNIRLKADGKELLDIEISKIFKDLNNRKIEIELYEVERNNSGAGMNFTRLL